MSQQQQWEIIQQKAFTRWVNAHLRKRGREIKDIIEDLKDGVQLINLYEIISEEQLGKYYPTPQSKFHKIANLNLILNKINSFVASVGIRVQFGPEQILDGVKQQVLGMIWCLIHKFEIQDISEEALSAREGLLLWCKKKTAGYKDVKVDNFNYSWEDGLAFAALIHKHRPDLLNFDEYQSTKENKQENLQKIFDLAEKHLDIPQILDAVDMVKYKPDDKAVMAYVAYYWKKFSSNQKAEKAAKKIGAAAKKQKELEAMQHEYEVRARALLAWINEAIAAYSDPEGMRKESNSLAKVTVKSGEFKEFKNKQKPPKLTDKNDLEVLLTNIRSKQKNEGLPQYNPPEELTTQAIDGTWDSLNSTQESYDKALSQHLALMKRLEILLGRFKSRSQKVLGWQTEKVQSMSAEDVKKLETISALQARSKIHEAFSEEVQSVEKSLTQLREVANEIISNEHEAAPEVQASLDSLNQQQTQVMDTAKELSTRLADELTRREELVRLCLEFARKAEQVNLFCEDALLSLIEPVRASSVKDVELYQNTVDGIEQEHAGENATALNDLAELEKKITAEEGNPTEFSKLSLAQVNEKYQAVRAQLDARKKDLGGETVTQQERATLLHDFSTQVNDYTAWTNKTKDVINNCVSTESSLEEQRATIVQVGNASIDESKSKVENLTSLFKKLEELDIAEQSPITLQALSVLGEQVNSFVKKRLESIEQQLVASKASTLTPEQVKDFKDVFVHFDKDRDGQLTKLDFKACCASLGEDIPDETLNEVFNGYDQNKDGKISFDEFIDFMVKINKASTGYEDVLDAFVAIAGGNAIVTEGQLRSCMDKEEVEYLLTKLKPVEGGLDYKTYLAETYGKN